jgi:hypothetical protein
MEKYWYEVELNGEIRIVNEKIWKKINGIVDPEIPESFYSNFESDSEEETLHTESPD